MSDQVQIRLMASTAGQLAAAIARLNAAGLEVTWDHSAARRMPAAYGFFTLYDTPETAEAKFRAATAAARQFIEGIECP